MYEYAFAEETSFFALLRFTLHLEFVLDHLRLLLLFLLSLLLAGRSLLLLIQQLLHADHLAQSQTHLVAKTLPLLATSLNRSLLRIHLLHLNISTSRGSHSNPLRVRSGYLRNESIR